MSFRKIRKKLAELFCRKSGQRPETLGVVLMVCIFHDTKMRARARSIQNLIYINSNVDTYDGLYYPDFAMSPEVGIHLGKKFFLGLAYHYVAIQNNHFIAFKLGWDF